MTLPASFPLSMSQIAAELGLSLPLSIQHAWVLALAGKSGPPVSFSDLLGQTAIASGNYTPSTSGLHTTINPGLPFFRGIISQLDQLTVAGPSYNLQLTSGSPAINWTGNIKVTGFNGNSAILVYQGLGVWSVSGLSSPLLQGGSQSAFTFQPST